MITADNITDAQIRPGVSVSWPHSDGTELTGVVVSHFGARLWNVREDRGTDHVVGEWILNARAKLIGEPCAAASNGMTPCPQREAGIPACGVCANGGAK